MVPAAALSSQAAGRPAAAAATGKRRTLGAASPAHQLRLPVQARAAAGKRQEA
jgi:hypothetical protein